MAFFISYTDLAGYCLVKELEKDPSKRTFTFYEIEHYGLVIEELFGGEKEGTIYQINKWYREKFINGHSARACFMNDGSEESVTLKEGITIEAIRGNLVSYMSIRLLEVILKNDPCFFGA